MSTGGNSADLTEQHRREQVAAVLNQREDEATTAKENASGKRTGDQKRDAENGCKGGDKAGGVRPIKIHRGRKEETCWENLDDKVQVHMVLKQAIAAGEIEKRAQNKPVRKAQPKASGGDTEHGKRRRRRRRRRKRRR